MESSQHHPEVKIRPTADSGYSDSDENSMEELQSATAQVKPAEYDAVSEIGVSEAETSILQMTPVDSGRFRTVVHMKAALKEQAHGVKTKTMEVN